MRRGLHVTAFLVLLALWTWKLLEPHPVPEGVAGGLSAGLKFGLAKSLHLVGYAFLTVLGGSVSRRARGGVIVFLVLHGIGTEIGQTYVPNRTGTVMDACIDGVGIALGAAVLRWWDRRVRA